MSALTLSGRDDKVVGRAGSAGCLSARASQIIQVEMTICSFPTNKHGAQYRELNPTGRRGPDVPRRARLLARAAVVASSSICRPLQRRANGEASAAAARLKSISLTATTLPH